VFRVEKYRCATLWAHWVRHLIQVSYVQRPPGKGGERRNKGKWKKGQKKEQRAVKEGKRGSGRIKDLDKNRRVGSKKSCVID